jgi:hypothetical protein
MKQIRIIKLVIEYAFMIKLFEIISVNAIYFRFGQTWASLTGTGHIVASLVGGGSRSQKTTDETHPTSETSPSKDSFNSLQVARVRTVFCFKEFDQGMGGGPITNHD